MSLPSQFTSTIRDSDAFSIDRWLEVEGIPYAYGSVTKSSAWFAARSALSQFLGIKAFFKKTPDSFDAEVDVLDGLAKFMGHVDFSITDIENEQTLWAGAWDNTYTRELSVALTKAGVTVSYSGAVADTTKYPTGGGTVYIGNETIAYTAHDTVNKKFTGCTRGKHRSRPQAWKVGSIISYKPYVLYGRRVWYYQTVTPTGGTAAVDADKVLRFSGTVENYTLDSDDPGAYLLSCLSLEKEFTREVFRDLRTIRDTGNRGIVGTDFTQPGIRFSYDPGATQPSTANRLYSADIHQLDENGTPYFSDGAYFMFKVDKEFILFQSSVASGSMAMIARGLMGTTVDEHKPGFSMQEVAILSRDVSGSSLWEHNSTIGKRFRSATDATSTAQSDHPLIVLLQILLSTGDGDNNDGGRNYDVLPAAWGLGIPYDRVDVAGIRRLANETPDLVLNGYWDKPIGFGAFAKQCLAPFGFYGNTQVNDLWTVRRLVPPLPDAVTRDLSSQHFVSKQKPSWDANLLGLVQEVEYLYNRDVQYGTWTRNTIFVNGLGKQYAQGKGRRLKYDLPQLYEKGLSPIPGRPPLGGMPNVELMLQERLEFLKQGFSLPPPVITRRFTYDCLDIEPGDLIKITDIMLPRIQDGIRGISLQMMRVLRKTIDEGSKTVELALQDCGFGIGDFGYIAPSAAGTISGGSSLTLLANEFTEATHVLGSSQKDYLPRDEAGTAYDWIQALKDGPGTVELVSKNFASSAVMTISTWNNATAVLTFTAALPGWFVNGDYVLPLRNSATTMGVLTSKYFVFLSDADEDLQGVRLAFRFYP